MKQKRLYSFTSFVSFLLLSISFHSGAQSFSFNTYKVEDGICDRFVYTINQDQDGYIWLGTGGGLCRYDGFEFRSDIITDSIPDSYVRCSYRDKEGNLWFGHDDGTISYYDGSNLHILNTSAYIYSRVNDILEDPEGNLLIASQNSGLLVINPNDTSDIKLKAIGPLLVYSVEFNSENNLLVATQDSVSVFSYSASDKNLPYIGKIDSLPEARFQKIFMDSHGDLLIGTADRGIFRVLNGTGNEESLHMENLGSEIGLERGNIQDIFEDIYGNIWLSTFRRGVYKMERDTNSNEIKGYQIYSEENGLEYNDITAVYQDLEGNIWIGTYGNGLALLVNEAFVFYDFADQEIGSNITTLYTTDSQYWFGGETGMLFTGMEIEGESKFYPGSDELSDSRITSIYPDPSGTIWIGTANQGLFQFDQKSGKYTSVYYARNSLENSINYITGTGTEVWIATSNGILIYNYETDEMLRFSTRDGLPHNKINHIFIDNQKRGWISTISNRLYYIQEGKLSLGAEINYFTKKNEFQAVAVSDEGEVWAATYGNGIYLFSDDSIYNYTVYDGLISDYCYSLLMGNDNLWIGHRLGFSRVFLPDTLITSFGRELGITSDCNPNAVVFDNRGAVVFGTNNGIIRYDPARDKGSQIPPINNIISFSFSDILVDLKEEIVMPFDRYKLKIDFIGLSYKNPELVTYQYKLENYDEEWSDLTRIPQANYGVADGEYTFLLRSYNRYWQTTEEPLAIPFIIKKPYWRTWWFITMVSVLFVVSVIVIIKVRERNQKILQARLEEELDERTKEVVEQKEEIELKNREITDSINYARRIQSSILPPIKKLGDNFPGFFVFYRPRDIVSGDFYWFDKVGDDRFIIVCADSTGHGVPGAFMSMIGSTMITDIVNRQEIVKPSEILTILDREITETLNQNIEAEQSTDGMDMIVCEVNLSKRIVRLASAMRPIIFFTKGEQIYLKGNRSSVGGEILEEKIFKEQEFQLDEGDIIYMFSDGYPDQFGGTTGKKFKMNRMKDMLDDIWQKSMEEQYEYVSNNLDMWRGDYEQVDDILFMAIKL